MWGTIAEWQQLYNGWKDGTFGDLKVEEMEEAAGRVAKSLQRLGREIKHWPAWAWIRVKHQFHATTCLCICRIDLLLLDLQVNHLLLEMSCKHWSKNNFNQCTAMANWLEQGHAQQFPCITVSFG